MFENIKLLCRMYSQASARSNAHDDMDTLRNESEILASVERPDRPAQVVELMNAKGAEVDAAMTACDLSRFAPTRGGAICDETRVELRTHCVQYCSDSPQLLSLANRIGANWDFRLENTPSGTNVYNLRIDRVSCDKRRELFRTAYFFVTCERAWGVNPNGNLCLVETRPAYAATTSIGQHIGIAVGQTATVDILLHEILHAQFAEHGHVLPHEVIAEAGKNLAVLATESGWNADKFEAAIGSDRELALERFRRFDDALGKMDFVG